MTTGAGSLRMSRSCGSRAACRRDSHARVAVALSACLASSLERRLPGARRAEPPPAADPSAPSAALADEPGARRRSAAAARAHAWRADLDVGNATSRRRRNLPPPAPIVRRRAQPPTRRSRRSASSRLASRTDEARLKSLERTTWARSVTSSSRATCSSSTASSRSTRRHRRTSPNGTLAAGDLVERRHRASRTARRRTRTCSGCAARACAPSTRPTSCASSCRSICSRRAVPRRPRARSRATPRRRASRTGRRTSRPSSPAASSRSRSGIELARVVDVPAVHRADLGLAEPLPDRARSRRPREDVRDEGSLRRSTSASSTASASARRASCSQPDLNGSKDFFALGADEARSRRRRASRATLGRGQVVDTHAAAGEELRAARHEPRRHASRTRSFPSSARRGSSPS